MTENSILIFPMTPEITGTLASLEDSYCQQYFLKTFPLAERNSLPKADEIRMEIKQIEHDAGKADEKTLKERKTELLHRYEKEIQNSEIWKKAEGSSRAYALRKVCKACDADRLCTDDLRPDEQKVYAMCSRVMKKIPGSDPVYEVRIIPTYPGTFETDYIWDKETGILYVARKKLASLKDFVRTLVLGRITAGYDAVYTYEIPEEEKRQLDEITEYILKQLGK